MVGYDGAGRERLWWDDDVFEATWRKSSGHMGSAPLRCRRPREGAHARRLEHQPGTCRIPNAMIVATSTTKLPWVSRPGAAKVHLRWCRRGKWSVANTSRHDRVDHPSGLERCASGHWSCPRMGRSLADSSAEDGSSNRWARCGGGARRQAAIHKERSKGTIQRDDPKERSNDSPHASPRPRILPCRGAIYAL